MHIHYKLIQNECLCVLHTIISLELNWRTRAGTSKRNTNFKSVAFCHGLCFNFNFSVLCNRSDSSQDQNIQVFFDFLSDKSQQQFVDNTAFVLDSKQH